MKSSTWTKLSCITQFRNAVAEFAERELAPRAAQIDKSNNFPSVSLMTKFM